MASGVDAFGDNRDLVQRVSALQAANAALEARLAAQEALMSTMQAELSSVQASEATPRTAASARSAGYHRDAFSWAVQNRRGFEELPDWLKDMGNYTATARHCFGERTTEDARIDIALGFLSNPARQWWSRACWRQAAWTWEEFVAELLVC